MVSYVGKLDNAVLVTNSSYQAMRMASVRQGKTKSLAELPEYKFFRTRYSRKDQLESAFIFISDATIRRWCGPKWRIADSRRTRARAVLAELQASQLEALVQHKVEPGPIHTDLPILGGGEIRLTPGGVVSSVYGSLEFMTPIGEMPLDEVTQDEAQAYGFWRDGYQRNWSWGFDPIGLRISLSKQLAAADLTILPLIMNSEYDNWVEVSRGAKFAPTAGDPHKSLVQFVMALNKQSRLFRQGEGFATMAVSGQAGSKITLGWVGPSVSVYADDDPFWDELAKVESEKLNDFMMKNIERLPVALRIDSTNPLGLAAFLAAARTYIEQTAPGLTNWEMLKYKDQGYVRVSPVKGTGAPSEVENAAIYYTTVGGALTVTLNERVLKRAMDRAAAGKPSPVSATEAKNESPAMTAKRRVAWLQRRTARRCPHPGGRQRLGPRAVRRPYAGPELEQLAGAQRMEAAFFRSRSCGRTRGGLGDNAPMSRRRKVRLEREVRHDGIDRLRTSRRAESRPAGPARAQQLCLRRLRPDAGKRRPARASGVAPAGEVRSCMARDLSGTS